MLPKPSIKTMILSFHPIFEGDHHRLCAGRDPDAEDLAAIARATAIILPQGCREALYRAAKRSGARVFPDYDTRFSYPGKIGQSRLFEDAGVPHPGTVRYTDTAAFFSRHPDGDSPLRLPAVVKLDWGGESEGVFPVRHKSELASVINHLQECETTGQHGFIIQQWIPAGSRSLRVVVMGHQMVSYWRTMPADRMGLASLAHGGAIDRASDRHLIAAAEAATAAFCRKTGVNLAGFDFLFSTDAAMTDPRTPLFLEINYFFGRRGLGGSDAYYRRLVNAIDHWLLNGGPHRPPPKEEPGG
jgi:ribosomal protein S6--L-glutamate ligase